MAADTPPPPEGLPLLPRRSRRRSGPGLRSPIMRPSKADATAIERFVAAVRARRQAPKPDTED